MEDSTRGRATRGRFLSAAGVTGAALAAGAWRTDVAGAAPRASKPARPSHAAGHFALELDGKGAGLVESVEGGAAVGTVVRELGRNTYYQKKHIGNVKYEEISFQAGTGLGKAFYDWISETLNGRGSRRSGAFVSTDFNYKELSTMSFQQALLTAVTFPALDAGAKETAYLTVEVAPETTKILSGSGRRRSRSAGPSRRCGARRTSASGSRGSTRPR
ncbi:MAG TPA: phage tail protein [Gaiellaceae bacterium]|nr:phage tail protein [Gaiellaceae bacterium]